VRRISETAAGFSRRNFRASPSPPRRTKPGAFCSSTWCEWRDVYELSSQYRDLHHIGEIVRRLGLGFQACSIAHFTAGAAYARRDSHGEGARWLPDVALGPRTTKPLFSCSVGWCAQMSREWTARRRSSDELRSRDASPSHPEPLVAPAGGLATRVVGDPHGPQWAENEPGARIAVRGSMSSAFARKILCVRVSGPAALRLLCRNNYARHEPDPRRRAACEGSLHSNSV